LTNFTPDWERNTGIVGGAEIPGSKVIVVEPDTIMKIRLRRPRRRQFTHMSVNEKKHMNWLIYPLIASKFTFYRPNRF
jgi:hypothetical protein